MDQMTNNPDIDLAFDFVQNTNRNIFLTGKAGTGKTTFLHNLRDVLPKRMVVVAPTGVAAINAKGVTIHSFFQMPFGPILPEHLRQEREGQNPYVKKFSKKKIDIIRTLDLLVIDEVSMVRADLLDGIDQVLRKYKNGNLPFGGTQVLLIGDLQQLAPVVKEDEWNLLRGIYETPYFFSSKVFQQGKFLSIELQHVYRQQDDRFLNILNEIREDRLSPASLAAINERCKPGFTPDSDDAYITLTTHNATANRINRQRLDLIKSQIHNFEAVVKGNFPEYTYPTEQFLELKKDAQVMFVKNDSSPEKRYFNGKIGRITGFEDDVIYVKCPGEDDPIDVLPETWENIRYSIDDNTKEIKGEVAGSFTQHPLRLAWAITIHKSQGLTFEKAVIDAQDAFAHGQTYVAFSRCKTLEGMVLRTRLSSNSIICDKTVGTFNKQVQENRPDDKTLSDSRNRYVISLLEELFGYRQVNYYLKKGLRQQEENATVIHGNLESPLKKMLQEGGLALEEVAQKFIKQLNHLAVKDEVNLAERIKKGSEYFYEQNKKLIIEHLDRIAFETDNRQVKKELREVLDKVRELIHIKQACLTHTRNGFDIKNYLHVRATAALEKVSAPKKSGGKPADPDISENPKLFNLLRLWRNNLAEKENIPAYMVLSQKAIIGISNELPVLQEQLRQVKGIGKKKAEQYGEIITGIVSKFCEENNIPLRADLPEKKKKKPKVPSRNITRSLWDEGKSIKEIAEERGFAEGTIEGHLAYFVGTGELNIEKFVEPTKIESIVEVLEKHPDAGMKLVKEELGEVVSWSDIRFVFQHLGHKGNTAAQEE